jgi:hypothetical protein
LEEYNRECGVDGSSKINVIIEQLRLRLGLPKPKPAPYNMRMADQTTLKPLGLIRDLKIYVHSIPYITTFIIVGNKFHTIWGGGYMVVINCCNAKKEGETRNMYRC